MPLFTPFIAFTDSGHLHSPGSLVSGKAREKSHGRVGKPVLARNSENNDQINSGIGIKI